MPLTATYHSKAKIRATIDYPHRMTMEDCGEWGACSVCANVIEHKRWPELIERAIDGTVAMHPEVNDKRARGELRSRCQVVLGAVFGESLTEKASA